MKPTGDKLYGSIPHLPMSKMGMGDKRIPIGQSVIFLEKFKHKTHKLIVQEKTDGSCVGAAKINGEIVPLTRAGYAANTSKYKQHQLWHLWVLKNKEKFCSVLNEGEKIIGEWLLQRHGTIYNLQHDPFIAFDIISNKKRHNYELFINKTNNKFTTPHLFHIGGPYPLHYLFHKIEDEPSGHGAEIIEGAVYRLENDGEVEALAKFVRPDHVPGKFLPGVTGNEELIETYNVDIKLFEKQLGGL